MFLSTVPSVGLNVISWNGFKGCAIGSNLKNVVGLTESCLTLGIEIEALITALTNTKICY